jgi:hypothetical protein
MSEIDDQIVALLPTGIVFAYEPMHPYDVATYRRIRILREYAKKEIPLDLMKVHEGEQFDPYEFIDCLCRRYACEDGFIPLRQGHITLAETIPTWSWDCNKYFIDQYGPFNHTITNEIVSSTPNLQAIADFVSNECCVNIKMQNPIIYIDIYAFSSLMRLFPQLMKSMRYRILGHKGITDTAYMLLRTL